MAIVPFIKRKRICDNADTTFIPVINRKRCVPLTSTPSNALNATNIIAGNPLISSASIGQIHSLNTIDIETQNVIIGSPEVGGVSFEFTIDTSLGTGTNDFQLPLPNETMNFMVDKGNGDAPIHITSYNQAETLLTYSGAFSGQISITGKCGGFRFANGGDKLKVTSVDSAGDVGFVSISSMWYGCSNLVTISMLGLDLSLAAPSSLSSFARGCTSCTLIECGDWDVSNQKDFSYFANGTDVTTLDVGNWDMSSATTLTSFANGCNLMATMDVSSWNTQNLITLTSFAQACSALIILDVSSWDVSDVTSTFLMCFNNSNMTTFDTTSWNTVSITNCSRMVDGCGTLTSNFTDTKWWNRAVPIVAFLNCFRNALNVPEYPVMPNNWKGL